MGDKFTKVEARYKDPYSPTGIIDKIMMRIRGFYPCIKCKNFNSNICKQVEGGINPEGSCIFWTKFGIRPIKKRPKVLETKGLYVPQSTIKDRIESFKRRRAVRVQNAQEIRPGIPEKPSIPGQEEEGTC